MGVEINVGWISSKSLLKLKGVEEGVDWIKEVNIRIGGKMLITQKDENLNEEFAFCI